MIQHTYSNKGMDGLRVVVNSVLLLIKWYSLKALSFPADNVSEVGLERYRETTHLGGMVFEELNLS